MGTQKESEANRREKGPVDTCLPEWTRRVRAVLEGAGPMPLASVARRITDATTNEVAMAVGWLAHAGEIRFSSRGEFWDIELAARSSEEATDETIPGEH